MPRYTDLALGAGAVLAVGLGLLALKPDSLPTPDESARSITTTLPDPLKTKASPSPSGAARPTGSATPSGSATASATTADAWVVGAGYGLAIRTEHRGCDAKGATSITVIGSAGGSISRTVDGLRAVGGIDVQSAEKAELVGVDDACERVGFATTDGGHSWSKLDTVPTMWSLVPGDRAAVHAPAGQVDVPCEPASITGLDDKVARLACTDGRLLGTVSGGDDWSILGNNTDMSAVGFVSATSALALASDDGCGGISVQRSTDGGTHFSAAYCVEGTGPWGLYTDADTAVVVGSDTVARSADGGEKWDVTQIRG